MCRYAYNDYKSHFACFSCRKTFKKTRINDFMQQRGMDQVFDRLCTIGERAPLPETPKLKRLQTDLGSTRSEIVDSYRRTLGICPQCRGVMASMGFDFQAPPMKDREAWKIIQALYEHGFAFAGCGCSVGYAPPKKMSGLPDFLSKHVRKSEGAKLLAAISAQSP